MSRLIGTLILTIVAALLLSACSQADRTQGAFNSWIRGCERRDVKWEVRVENGRTFFTSNCVVAK